MAQVATLSSLYGGDSVLFQFLDKPAFDTISSTLFFPHPKYTKATFQKTQTEYEPSFSWYGSTEAFESTFDMDKCPIFLAIKNQDKCDHTSWLSLVLLDKKTGKKPDTTSGTGTGTGTGTGSNLEIKLLATTQFLLITINMDYILDHCFPFGGTDLEQAKLYGNIYTHLHLALFISILSGTSASTIKGILYEEKNYAILVFLCNYFGLRVW